MILDEFGQSELCPHDCPHDVPMQHQRQPPLHRLEPLNGRSETAAALTTHIRASGGTWSQSRCGTSAEFLWALSDAALGMET